MKWEFVANYNSDYRLSCVFLYLKKRGKQEKKKKLFFKFVDKLAKLENSFQNLKMEK